MSALNVLFLCTGNSARSILAECILNRLGAGRFRAYSAGSYPKGAVHPQALALLKSMQYDVSDLRSKSWDEFSGPGAPKLDFIFTVCDNAAQEPCPFWPGHPVSAHWGIPDPAGVSAPEPVVAQAFAEAYQRLSQRISIFVNLPPAALDHKALQEIGEMKDEPWPTS
jgi:protein-tyrosine-phosphatase